jgi:hypothetical protein
MDYLADHLCASAGCEDEQQQVNVIFRPRALVRYLLQLTLALTVTSPQRYKTFFRTCSLLLNPWNWICFEKLIVAQNLRIICGIWSFSIVFTRALRWPLSWASWISFTYPFSSGIISDLKLIFHAGRVSDNWICVTNWSKTRWSN